jgi:phage tail sheath protein FI
MPEYLSPGVYVEEISTGPVPIEGVSTSTSGFVGQTARGPTNPMLVTSFIDFQRTFGGLLDPSISMLPFAAKGFFDNGGQRLFIARVVGAGGKASTLDVGGGLTVEAVGPGTWGKQIFVRIQAS